jgi:GMP synthase (glutamine-hydrolysing)
MVSAREPWSERTGEWLARAVDERTPLLGICYGHQLLAHALGGEVGSNPRGREIGTVEVQLTDEGRLDTLLGILPPRFRVQATHMESVLTLPKGARVLASNAADPHQAFAIGDRAWAVQFHPEADVDAIRGYIEARAEKIREEGLDPDALVAAATDTEHGTTILRRFAELSGVASAAARRA